MTSLTLPFPSGRGAPEPRMLRFLNGLADGFREGLEMARRYDDLAHMSTSDLARLGLRRADIPQAVLHWQSR